MKVPTLAMPVTHRRLSAGCLAAIAWVAASALLAGQAARSATQAARSATRYTATTVNLSAGNARQILIEVFNWSSDADRDKLVAALGEKGDAQVAEALKAAPTVGYFWTSTDGVGYAIKYAYRSPIAGGGERIVLATDRPVGSWERGGWRTAAQAAPSDAPFTLIEIRLNARGVGEGKMSLAAPIAADAALKSIALSGYDTAPVLLKDVRRQAGT
jgi:hypothetical protein